MYLTFFKSSEGVFSFLYYVVNFRFTCAENKAAARELQRKYDDNIVGMVLSKIFAFHQDKDICYVLDEQADKLFEEITDKYSGQFNLKYSTASQLSSSQPELDTEEKSEISVRTKATELIGRLTCVLWVYCNGKYTIYICQSPIHYIYL